MHREAREERYESRKTSQASCVRVPVLLPVSTFVEFHPVTRPATHACEADQVVSFSCSFS